MSKNRPSNVQLANIMSQICSSNGKYLTFILQELLNITVDNHVTLPLFCNMAFVDILEDLAHTSALFTFLLVEFDF